MTVEEKLEIEHRLTEVEQRGKSNTHRLDKLEPIVDEIHIMSKTMVQLVEAVKNTNESVNNLNKKVDFMDIRMDDMEKAPAKKLNNVKETVIGNITGALIGFLMAGLLWAANQAF